MDYNTVSQMSQKSKIKEETKQVEDELDDVCNEIKYKPKMIEQVKNEIQFDIDGHTDDNVLYLYNEVQFLP